MFLPCHFLFNFDYALFLFNFDYGFIPSHLLFNFDCVLFLFNFDYVGNCRVPGSAARVARLLLLLLLLLRRGFLFNFDLFRGCVRLHVKRILPGTLFQMSFGYSSQQIILMFLFSQRFTKIMQRKKC